MLSKWILGILMVLFGSMVHYGEIIQTSKLNKEKTQWIMKRDIFSQMRVPVKMTPRQIQQISEKEQAIEEKKENDENKIQREVMESVIYEGYVKKSQNTFALVSVGGEYYFVTPGELILERIKIVHVGSAEMIVEVESQNFEIKLKGDEDD